MKLITRRSNAATAASRWESFYHVDGRWRAGCTDAQLIYEALLALGPDPDPDDVDRVIGDDSWTDSRRECSECKAESDSLVRVGEEPDYESETAYLCAGCLNRALDLAESSR